MFVRFLAFLYCVLSLSYFSHFVVTYFSYFVVTFSLHKLMHFLVLSFLLPDEASGRNVVLHSIPFVFFFRLLEMPIVLSSGNI